MSLSVPMTLLAALKHFPNAQRSPDSLHVYIVGAGHTFEGVANMSSLWASAPASLRFLDIVVVYADWDAAGLIRDEQGIKSPGTQTCRDYSDNAMAGIRVRCVAGSFPDILSKPGMEP